MIAFVASAAGSSPLHGPRLVGYPIADRPNGIPIESAMGGYPITESKPATFFWVFCSPRCRSLSIERLYAGSQIVGRITILRGLRRSPPTGAWLSFGASTSLRRFSPRRRSSGVSRDSLNRPCANLNNPQQRTTLAAWLLRPVIAARGACCKQRCLFAINGEIGLVFASGSRQGWAAARCRSQREGTAPGLQHENTARIARYPSTNRECGWRMTSREFRQKSRWNTVAGRYRVCRLQKRTNHWVLSDLRWGLHDFTGSAR